MSTNKIGLSAGRPSARKAAVSVVDKELIVRINVELPESARAKLKMHAIKSKKTISDLLREYVAGLPD